MAGLVSLQPPRALESVAEPHLQWVLECRPKARIALDPVVLHAPLFSCPACLIGADTSLGSVCVAKFQLSPALNCDSDSEHWIKEFYSMQLLSQGKKRLCALGLSYKLSITTSRSIESCCQAIV